MIEKIGIIGMWILFLLGAALISFGLVGVSAPIESEWHLELPFVTLNLLGGVMVISLSTLGYYQLNKYKDDLSSQNVRKTSK